MKIHRLLLLALVGSIIPVSTAQIGVKPLIEKKQKKTINRLKQYLADSIPSFDLEKESMHEKLLGLHKGRLSFSDSSSPANEYELSSRMPIFIPDTSKTMPVYTLDTTITHYLKVYGKKEA